MLIQFGIFFDYWVAFITHCLYHTDYRAICYSKAYVVNLCNRTFSARCMNNMNIEVNYMYILDLDNLVLLVPIITK